MTAPVAELAGARLGHDSHVVLERVDLRVEADEIVALVGGSGTGKTTILEALIGLLAPLAGDARLFGMSLMALQPRARGALLSRLGVVFQRDALFQAMTVSENLAVAARVHLKLPEPVIEELSRIRLEQVGLTGFGDRHPYELSGGQQKRVAFARAVMLEPDLLVFDEPTAGLDPLSAGKLERLIEKLHSETQAAVLIVTHDIHLARRVADRIIVLGRGRLLASGTAADLKQNPEPLVRELFELSADGARP